MKQNKKYFAFTLVEVLLGFLIFSLAALVLYGTFFSGLKIQQRSNESGTMYHQLKMTLDMIAFELEQAIYFDMSILSPKTKIFDGQSQEISFAIIDKDGSIKKITYFLQDREKVSIFKTLIGRTSKNNVTVVNSTQQQDQAKVLMRKEEPLIVDDDQKTASDFPEEVVLDHIKNDSFAFSYAYLSAGEGDKELVWQETWDKEYLPAGIRLDVTILPVSKNEKPVTIRKDIYNPIGSWGEAL